MWINFLARYAIVIFLAILVYLLFRDRSLFLKAIISCVFIWIINRILGALNIYLFKFFPQTFPSDHTAIGFGIGVSIFFKRRIPGLILIFLAILMGWARVLAGFHEFRDIIGGAIIGSGCAFLMNKMTKSKMPG